MKIPAQLCVIALFFANCAHAQVWFQDDFESNTTVNTVAYPSMIPPTPAGDFNPDAPAIGSWTITEDYPELAQVSSFTGGIQPTAAHSGNNYLIAGHNCDLPGAMCGQAKGLASADLASSVSQATLDFWMWSRQYDGRNTQYDLIQAREPELGALEGVAFEMSFFNLSDGTNEIKWDTLGGNRGTVLNAQLTTDAWNHIVVDYDGVAGFADITINDEPTETFGTRPAFAFPNTFSEVIFRSENRGYFDDIRISTGSPLAGDFDGDGDVDGNDLLEWQRSDGTAQGLVDWEANFGSTSGSEARSLTAVPEPTALSFVTVTIGLAACRRRRRA